MGAHSFTTKKKLNPTLEELEAIRSLQLESHESFEDLDNPQFDWHMIGRDKYGRFMYCPKTNRRRTLTMGEFYQTGVVD